MKIVAPLHYQFQVLTQVKLAGLDWAMIGALAVDAYKAHLYVVDVELVDSAWEFIKARVADFWERFDSGRTPDLTPALDAKALAALYPVDNGQTVDLTGDPEAKRLLSEWESEEAILKAAKKQIKPHEERLREIKNQFKAKLGANETGLVNGYHVSWKTQHRAAVAATSFRVIRKKKVKI